MDRRSGCPINLAVEVLGDRWSVIVLRDLMFGEARTYRALLNGSLEGIATNILAARLKHLEAEGLVTVAPDPDHRQKKIYSLTEKAISLVPLIVHLGAWGRRQIDGETELTIRARLLEEGGPGMWEDFQTDLRARHLGIDPPPGHRPVFPRLQAAFKALAGRE